MQLRPLSVLFSPFSYLYFHINSLVWSGMVSHFWQKWQPSSWRRNSLTKPLQASLADVPLFSRRLGHTFFMLTAFSRLEMLRRRSLPHSPWPPGPCHSGWGPLGAMHWAHPNTAPGEHCLPRSVASLLKQQSKENAGTTMQNTGPDTVLFSLLFWCKASSELSSLTVKCGHELSLATLMIIFWSHITMWQRENTGISLHLFLYKRHDNQN